ncbi:MAG: MarC family protein, partial [Planctomycetota bacterium]|nr:MarC family protein [Planctomycetota bacterium]
MPNIWPSLIPFVAILNPLALCLYLVGVMEDLDRKNFTRVLFWACAISLAAFWGFALAGNQILDLLGIRPGALRAFGGIIFLVVGYNYVAKGYKTAEALRGSLDELPSAISLPFMIGGGTITQSIL